MRAKDFLPEYSDPATAQKEIIAAVSGLRADNEQDAKLLDRIYLILNNEGLSSKIATAFEVPVSDENFNLKPLLQKLTTIIFNVDVDYKKINDFLTKLESGNVVDIAALTKPGVSSVRDFFAGDETATKVFQAMAELGAGKKQKGPGEYALAMLSNKIQLRTSEGDLDVEGFGKLEVKAETTSGGGRLGEGGPSNKVAAQYWSQLPSIEEHLKTSKGLGIGNFVRYIANDLPLNDPEKKQQRQELLTKWYGNLFSEPAPFVEAFMQDDPQQPELLYGKANFNLYKKEYGWDGLLSINFPNLKAGMCVSGDDFVTLKQAGHYGSFSISVVPSSARPSEVFCQLSMSKAKI